VPLVSFVELDISKIFMGKLFVNLVLLGTTVLVMVQVIVSNVPLDIPVLLVLQGALRFYALLVPTRVLRVVLLALLGDTVARMARHSVLHVITAHMPRSPALVDVTPV